MFWAPCGSWEGAGGWGVSGGMGGIPTHTHTHVDACTCTHAHLYMYRNYKWPPTWRHPCLACLACLTCMCMLMCMCVCVCACMGHPATHPYPPPPPSTHLVDPRNHLKFDNTSTFQDISIPFEDLKSVKNSPPWVGVWFGGWVFGWVGWWVGSGQITKNLKIVDWIKIIQFCLKIYDL